MFGILIFWQYLHPADLVAALSNLCGDSGKGSEGSRRRKRSSHKSTCFSTPSPSGSDLEDGIESSSPGKTRKGKVSNGKRARQKRKTGGAKEKDTSYFTAEMDLLLVQSAAPLLVNPKP